MKDNLHDLDRLMAFDAIIDVRSPGEFAEDHIPGAINCPVLDDAEREKVGTLYKQVSAFEAKKVGAALVARNIARHLDGQIGSMPRQWRPLIYCWRGGNRSGAMTHILRSVGWPAVQLEGGYKRYRHWVLQKLETLPPQLQFRVVSGPTGSGKSRLLHALRNQGLQVLDLEDLARHRGSLLGSLPTVGQPSQKMFDSLLVQALQGFDLGHPVYVEAESKKVGVLRVHEAIIQRMWQGEVIRLNVALPARIALLKAEYHHFLENTDLLLQKLAYLTPLHGHAVMARWQDLVREGRWDEFVGDLLVNHYDPAYQKSLVSHYGQSTLLGDLHTDQLDAASLAHLASCIARL